MSTGLHEAVEHMADLFSHVAGCGDFLQAMTCSEVNAVADVLRAADRNDVADLVVFEHAQTDESFDLHYDLNENKGD